MGNNPISRTDPDGGEDDWYRTLDENGNPTNEYVWFAGSAEIEVYIHKGASFYDAVTVAFAFSDATFKTYRIG